MNKKELQAEMVRHGDKTQTLADALGITAKALYMKINEKNSFTQVEIQQIIERYQLGAEDVQRIFFTCKVS